MLNEQAQSVVLLTAVFGKSTPNGSKPLSVSEWADFAQMLHNRDAKPAQLLSGDVAGLMADWPHRSITVDRVQRLLDRGTALGLCLEQWERAGLWLLTRSDSDYPRQLKERLKWKSPAVLFGAGNKKVVGQPSLAVVGSRAASPDHLEAAKQLGQEAAAAGHAIVSGGARGVDETAMMASIEAEGRAVGILAGDLKRFATSRKYRAGLTRGDLALLSPFAPEARFQAGNAMARNRYIYCLAKSAVVVTCKMDTGGTWRGAIENLRHDWGVPTWAWFNEHENGNRALVEEHGASWLGDGQIAALFAGGHQTKAAEKPKLESVLKSTSLDPTFNVAKEDTASLDHYGLFLQHMRLWASQAPLNLEDLAHRAQVRKDQMRTWLNRASKDGRVCQSGDKGFLFVHEPNEDTAQGQLSL